MPEDTFFSHPGFTIFRLFSHLESERSCGPFYVLYFEYGTIRGKLRIFIKGTLRSLKEVPWETKKEKSSVKLVGGGSCWSDDDWLNSLFNRQYFCSEIRQSDKHVVQHKPPGELNGLYFSRLRSLPRQGDVMGELDLLSFPVFPTLVLVCVCSSLSLSGYLLLHTMPREWSSTCPGETVSASVPCATNRTASVLPPPPLPQTTRVHPWREPTWSLRTLSKYLFSLLSPCSSQVVSTSRLATVRATVVDILASDP